MKNKNETNNNQDEDRATAYEESTKLTNLITLLGGGVALVPLPGTSVALSGLEILLMGGIGTIYGQPLTGTVVASVLTGLAMRLGVTTVLTVLSDLLVWVPVLGQVAKPAIAMFAIKIVGTGMNDLFASFTKKRKPAEVTAEEALEKIKSAYERLKTRGSELKDSIYEALKGNGDKLATMINDLLK